MYKRQREIRLPTVHFLREKDRFTSWCYMSEDRRQAKHNLCTWNYLRLKKNATKLPKTKIMNTTLSSDPEQ